MLSTLFSLVAPAALLLSQDASSVVLTGTVRAADGVPVPRAVIWSYSASGDLRRSLSGPDGTYALMKVDAQAADRVGVWATADGYFSTELELPDSIGAVQHQVDVTIVARPSIVVRVVDAQGAPALAALRAEARLAPLLKAELQAVATLEPASGRLDLTPLPRIQTYGAGLFEAPRSPMPDVLGTLTLDASEPAFVHLVAFGHVLASERVVPTDTDVTFELSTARLLDMLASVRVRFIETEESLPIRGDGVLLGHRYDSGFDGRVRTDDDGWMSFVDQPPGRRWLRFDGGQAIRPPAEEPVDPRNRRLRLQSHRTYGRHTFEFDVVPGASLDLGAVPLVSKVLLRGAAVDAGGSRRATILRVRSIDASGRPAELAGPLYSSNDDLEAIARVARSQTVLIEVTGKFEAEQPHATVYCGEPVRIQVGDEDVKDLVFPVVRASYLRTIIPEHGSGLFSRLALRVVDRNGLDRNPVSAGGRRVDGGYLRGGVFLAPGRYTLEVRSGDRLERSAVVDVSGEELTVVL